MFLNEGEGKYEVKLLRSCSPIPPSPSFFTCYECASVTSLRDRPSNPPVFTLVIHFHTVCEIVECSIHLTYPCNCRHPSPRVCEHAWPLRLLAPQVPDHAWRNRSRPRHPAGARAERSDQARDVTARSLSKQFPRCLGSRQSVALQPLPPTPTYTLFFFFFPSFPSTLPTELPSFRAVGCPVEERLCFWTTDAAVCCCCEWRWSNDCACAVSMLSMLSHNTDTRCVLQEKGESNLIKGLSKLIVTYMTMFGKIFYTVYFFHAFFKVVN